METLSGLFRLTRRARSHQLGPHGSLLRLSQMSFCHGRSLDEILMKNYSGKTHGR
jgi:hypothetical protein